MLPLNQYLQNIYHLNYFEPLKPDFTTLPWLERIKATNELIRSHPEIHKEFSQWHANFVSKYNRTPEPPITIDRVHRFIHSHKEQLVQQNIQEMSRKYIAKRTFTDLYGGVSDAEAIAAAQQVARKRPYQQTIRIVKPSIPRALSAKKDVKGVDTSLALNPVIATTNTNGSIFVLNLIQQGAGSFNRIGKKIYPVSVRCKGVVSFSNAVRVAGTDGNKLRAILVWDRSPNGAAIPAFDVIFGTTDQTGTEASNMEAVIRYDAMDRFKILKEWCIIDNPGNSGTNTAGDLVEDFHSFDEYLSFKKGKYESLFGSTTNPMTIADVANGALYLVFRVQQNTADNIVSISANSFARLRYTD